ncbi:MAG: AAA-like domain-containing protein [Timaviella obliquedivisa GSE-PSE-MK23-08B]|nr:AAA-like domain-containing protein [Timaviella obliquedivisa GSE-PSE-MK23-08B]
MTPDEALIVLEILLQPKCLSDLQQTVFCRAWVGLSYEEISEELAYDPGYIRDVGSQLWSMLSKVLGEKVTKKNVHVALRRYQREQESQQTIARGDRLAIAFLDDLPEASPFRLEFPSGVVALNSPFYVERSPIEAQTLREIHKPGSLVRIKAPRQMGKSSFMHRILAHAKQSGLQTATLNLQRADSSVLGSLDKFLRWICANIAQQLDLAPILDDYWNLEMGSKMSCTLYFQRYLLEAIDTALVLAFDEVNRLFEYPDLALDFLPLLRSWYEDASEFAIWQKLRLVVVHSTEAYIPLNINQSPFNVGLPIRLPEFTLEQVQDLALRHGLNWAKTAAGVQDLRSLLEMIGGHPYLVRLALYALRQQMSLEQLLQEAPTTAGIYGEHLRHHLNHLHEHPELAIALQQILSATPGQLEAMTLYKLESLGLIKFQGNQAILSRELYRLYFQNQLI